MDAQYYTHSSAQKNIAVCRKELEFIPNGNFVSEGYEECRNMQFFQVMGIARFWEEERELDSCTLTADILNGCIRYGLPFAFVLVGDERGIHVYVGTTKTLLNAVKSSYQAVYPGIDIEAVEDNPLRSCPREYGGMFTGIPTDKMNADQPTLQIESICRGMQGKRFSYIILASGLSGLAVTFGHERLLEEMELVYSLINQTITGGAQGNLSAQRQDFQSKNYFENLEILERHLKEGTVRGMWRMNGYYAADSQEDAQRLSNMIRACYSGDESTPEPFRLIPYNSIREVIPNMYMMADLAECQDVHPLGRWHRDGISQDITLYIYKFQTILTSSQLGVLCRLPVKEFQGYYVDEYVEFDVAERNRTAGRDAIPLGDICTAGRSQESREMEPYYIEKHDLTRHALIIGITGGGKTNTSKSILNTLWNAVDSRERIPFLVIESAKREYWELRNLKGFENLLIFTLGAEAERTSVKYRINPFETNPGISLQTHIDYLLSTFKAAFDLYPPMPYILEKAVYAVYDDRGWDIVENQNRYGLIEYPTLEDLYNKVDVIVDELGYHQEVQSNVKAALQARIYSLMIGGKGAMMNTPKSVPIGELLERPVVMELEDLGDDETKSFVMGILMVQLYEYRKSQMTQGSKALSHILLIEEAHRLLKNVPESGEGGNTRAKSVEFFCNMLAEIRTFGQGIIVADQIPTKLAPDTIKNTNLKIVHRTVAQEDRETIGRAMNMSQQQIEYLSSLQRGYAAVYAEGDSRPKCVKMPLVLPFYDKNRDEVIQEARRQVYNLAENYDKKINHHCGCAFCEEQCAYYQRVKEYIDSRIDVGKVLKKWQAVGYRPPSLKAFLVSGIMEGLKGCSLAADLCCVGYILQAETDLKDGQRQKIIADYLRYIFKEKE